MDRTEQGRRRLQLEVPTYPRACLHYSTADAETHTHNSSSTKQSNHIPLQKVCHWACFCIATVPSGRNNQVGRPSGLGIWGFSLSCCHSTTELLNECHTIETQS